MEQVLVVPSLYRESWNKKSENFEICRSLERTARMTWNRPGKMRQTGSARSNSYHR